MTIEQIETLIVGAGQAGLAMSEHLGLAGRPHLILERDRIVERWRTSRWDSLVANGPAWHDRFPSLLFKDIEPDAFPTKDGVVEYFTTYAEQINAPIRCGVEVLKVSKKAGRPGFTIKTSQGLIDAANVVAATGPFQTPVIPPVVPKTESIVQLHSNAYRNPEQLPDGAVLVVGAGSSGSQIADELLRSGKSVYLSVGAHDRPPRKYRGRDFVWWLGVLGKWDAAALAPGTEHVTIAVSGSNGGKTIDFRRFAERGMTLVGLTQSFKGGVIKFAPDLQKNICSGDANYLSVLDEADAYIARNGLDLPKEPNAKIIDPDPDCIKHPILELDLVRADITSIIWATGYACDYSWLDIDTLDAAGKPVHQRGISDEPGIYFLGLPWQSRRGSSFIWGVWHDAKYVAEHICKQRGYWDYHDSTVK
ncbi:MAG: putative flavoprotein involved in K+ transport [Granulosicoccus sp.]|jgi:putative flavoprotein involved in K+ transport